ncbi:MAG TPA: RNA polymerase sigma factor [Bacteroidia bacterium]|jgi:RNA polymerase sigma factor (sigma-70 family)|nr:RNA polymerase sigma factor [Bacteroidia bacterium]
MTIKEFNTCVDLYADGLYRFILKHVKDTDVARDLVQDTYEKLWLKVNDVESKNAKSYMFTTGYHTTIDYLRRAKKSERLDFDKHPEETGKENSNYDLKTLLNKALELLPEIQKSVVLLRDYEGYDYKEIGTITGLTESQVKVYIFRARQTLKEYLVKAEVHV